MAVITMPASACPVLDLEAVLLGHGAAECTHTEAGLGTVGGKSLGSGAVPEPASGTLQPEVKQQ